LYGINWQAEHDEAVGSREGELVACALGASRRRRPCLRCWLAKTSMQQQLASFNVRGQCTRLFARLAIDPLFEPLRPLARRRARSS
jgi:hypothetical protein